MKKLNLALKITNLALLICFFSLTISCSSSNDSSSNTPAVEYPERLVDLTLNFGSLLSTPVMIALNINTSATSQSQSGGISPRTPFLKNKFRLLPKKRFSMHVSNTSTITGPHKRTSSPTLAVTDTTTTTTFQVYNFKNTTSPLTKIANRIYNGTSCYMFIDTTDEASVSQADIDTIGSFFDNTIYNRAQNYFTSFYDADNNNKIIILIYDFNNDDIAGYFWSDDFFASSSLYTNQADMLYMNSSYFKNLSASTGSDKTAINNVIIDTLAHELQHLLNFSSRIKTSNSNYINTTFDTWIEEGIAEGVVPYLTDNSLNSTLSQLNNSEIRNGNGLFTWNSLASDYALSFSFFEYLRIQTDSNYNFYKQLMESYSSGSNYLAVNSVITAATTNPFTNFNDAVLSYKIANFYNISSGKYGYKNEYSLPALSSPTTSSVSLQAGGSSYFTSNLNEFIPTNVGDNVYYYRINYTP